MSSLQFRVSPNFWYYTDTTTSGITQRHCRGWEIQQIFSASFFGSAIFIGWIKLYAKFGEDVGPSSQVCFSFPIYCFVWKQRSSSTLRGQILQLPSPCKNWGSVCSERKDNPAIQVNVLDFRYFTSFLNQNTSKSTGTENLRQISDSLNPCKNQRGLCEMYESVFIPSFAIPRTNHWRSALAVWEIGVWTTKKV